MANDRLWLACTVCRSRSPMLGKWWGDRFESWSDQGTIDEWIGRHWLQCGRGAGPAPFVVLDEDRNYGACPMEKPDADLSPDSDPENLSPWKPA